jgi:predicted nucleotidyltransferase
MDREPKQGGELVAGAAEVAARLAADPRVALVFVFGSAADPSRKLARDLDIAVLTDPPLALEDVVRLRADLVVAAGLPIDLVSLNDASIVLAHEVVEVGRCLFARDPDVETSFVTRTRARYWDFEPYRREQWRLAGERVEERLRGSQA